MPVSSVNVRLVTTISKATDAEIKRMAEQMGVPERMVVSMALSLGLKVVAVQLDPSAFLTPQTVAAMSAFAGQAGLPTEPSAEEAARMEADLRLALEPVQPAKAKRKTGAKVGSRKK